MGIFKRLYFIALLIFGVVGSVLMTVPALVYWILTGGDLLGKWIDFLNEITPEFD